MLLLVALSLAVAAPALAAPVTPGASDPSFGRNGFVFTDRVSVQGEDGSSFDALDLLTDGTIQLRGRSRCGMACSQGSLTRLSSAGRYLSSTGFPFLNDDDGPDPNPPQGVGLVALPDGGMVVSYDDAGAPGAPAAQPHLLRVLAPGGAILRQVGLPRTFAPASIDSGGRIVGFAGLVINGIALYGDPAQLMRLGPDLAPDPTFGADGLVTLPPELLRAGLVSATTSDVRVAGWDGNALLLVRLGPDGSLSRVTRVPVSRTSPNGASLSQLIVRNGHTLVVGGSVDSGAVIVAFLPDGRLDRRFGRAGILRVAGSTGRAVAVQGDGRIVVVGTTGPYGSQVAGARLVLRRYTAAGRPDRSFPTRIIRTRARDFETMDVAIDGRGRIVVAAALITPEWVRGVLLARFLPGTR